MPRGTGATTLRPANPNLTYALLCYWMRQQESNLQSPAYETGMVYISTSTLPQLILFLSFFGSTANKVAVF